MSLSKSGGNDLACLNSSDINYLKCWASLVFVGKEVLLKIFNWLYIGGNTPVKEFFLNNLKYSNGQYKSVFVKTHRQKLDANVLENFDISLLYILFQRVCNLPHHEDNVWVTEEPQPKLPYNLYLMKTIRNKFAHPEMKLDERLTKDIINNIKSLLIVILDQVHSQFNICSDLISKVKQYVTTEINKLLNFTPPANTLKDQLRQIWNEKISIMRSEGKEELCKTYINRTQVLISHWPLSEEYKNVDEIYSDVQLNYSRYCIMQNQMHPNEVKVDVKDIFTTKRLDGNTPGLILISGESGMGKTTLLKYIINDWISKNRIKSIDAFDFVLYMDCRFSKFKTIEDLLTSLMPKSQMLFASSEIKCMLLSMNLLFILDNLNELCENSLNMFKELLQTNSNITILGTSNSAIANEISKKSQIKKTLCLDINGVSKEKLVENLFKLIPSCKISTLSQDAFLTQSNRYENICSCEHFNSPLILTHLFFQWIANNGTIESSNSVTHLFLKSQTVLINKVREKLENGPNIQFLGNQLIQQKIMSFINVLGEVAIRLLRKNSKEENNACFNILLEKCKSLNLPPDSIMSEFFCFKEINPEIDLLENSIYFIDFPSKSIHEFYCAFNIYNEILRSPRYSSNLKYLITGNEEKIDNISRIKSTLKFLVGILCLKNEEILIKYTQEIIALIKQCGVTSSNEWVGYIDEAKDCKDFIVAIRNQMGNCWTFEDYSISESLSKLLKINPPQKLTLSMCIHETTVEHLPDILGLCSTLPNLELKLHLYNHFWFNQTFLSDNLFRKIASINSLCKLKSFAGRLSTSCIKKLPTTLNRLALQISLENIPIINETLKQLTELDVLYLNFSITNYTPEDINERLMISKQKIALMLDIWQVTNENIFKSSTIISKISMWYSKLVLRNTSLIPSDIISWLDMLRKLNIEARSIVIGSSESINSTEEEKCANAAKILNCVEFKWIKTMKKNTINKNNN